MEIILVSITSHDIIKKYLKIIHYSSIRLFSSLNAQEEYTCVFILLESQ